LLIEFSSDFADFSLQYYVSNQLSFSTGTQREELPKWSVRRINHLGEVRTISLNATATGQNPPAGKREWAWTTNVIVHPAFAS
jgi:hypothetical protein